MAYVLLAPAQAAAASESFNCVRPHLPAVFRAPGLAGSEVVTLQQSINGTWEDLYLDSTIQQLTATHRALAVYGPGVYRGNKGLTAAAVGVYVSTDRNP